MERNVTASASTGQLRKGLPIHTPCFFSVSGIPARNLAWFPSGWWQLTSGSEDQILAARASIRFSILSFCRGKKTTTACWRNKQKWLLFCKSSDLEDPYVHISFSCYFKHSSLAQSPSQLCELTVESFCKATVSYLRCLKISLLPVLVSESSSLARVTISYFPCLFSGMS